MQPVGNSYLVKRITTKEKNNMGAFTNTTPTPGAMNTPEKPEDASMKGEVVELPKLVDKGEEHICKKGDKIMFRYGEPIEVDGTDYLLVSRYDIKLIL